MLARLALGEEPTRTENTMASKRAKKRPKPRTAKKTAASKAKAKAKGKGKGKATERKPAKAAPPKAAAKAAAKPRAANEASSSATNVGAHMTRSPHTIGRDQTLALAHELMNKHRIRHLPVLEGGQLVGMLSQRDLYFVESLDSSSPGEVKVEEAMTQDVFEVGKDTPLASVVDTMLQHKHGCAVVTDGGKVSGVFSTIDALGVLLEKLR